MARRIRNTQISNPRPLWMQLLPNSNYGVPFPYIVVEISVNKESPTVLEDFAQRYFSASASVRVWIAVKISLQENRYRVGWGERRPDNTGCMRRIHTRMDWPPNHAMVATPINLTYQIPTY